MRRVWDIIGIEINPTRGEDEAVDIVVVQGK